MKSSRNFFCIVCGYDFRKEGKVVCEYTLCPCCLFHYGVDEVGNIQAFNYYRNEWLKSKWHKKTFENSGIKSKEDLINQMLNIENIDPQEYYFGHDIEMHKNFNEYSLDLVAKKWEDEFTG